MLFIMRYNFFSYSRCRGVGYFYKVSQISNMSRHYIRFQVIKYILSAYSDHLKMTAASLPWQKTCHDPVYIGYIGYIYI